MRRLRWPPPAEINNGAPQDTSGCINAHLSLAASVEEAQAEFSLIGINSLLAEAGDGACAHQRWDIGWGDVQKLSEHGGIDHEIVIGDFHRRNGTFGPHSRLVRTDAADEAAPDP
jgi:hypothetical protein